MVILTFKAPRAAENLDCGPLFERREARDIARLVEGAAGRFSEAKKPLRCEALNIWDDEAGL
nr:hypothetical protein [uncultured Shinella sp.]